MKRLVFFPTGCLSLYQDSGYDDIGEYYNPGNFFDEVTCLSLYEEKYKEIQGIKIRPISSRDEYTKAIKELRPDVIRVYGPFFPADFAIYYKIKGIPIIVSVHNVDYISPSIRFANEVICMSEAVRREVERIGVDPNRVVVMPNRVNHRLFSDRRGCAETEEVRRKFPTGKMILTVARKCEQKNTDNIVKSLKFLPKEYFCVFVGKGPDDYKTLADENGVGDRCFWVDSVPKSELSFWYSAADCFCLPSRWEGFGIVFLEAAACGTPIVTSNIAPMNEFLNCQNSIMVEEHRNPESIAKSVEYACTSLQEISVLVSNAREMTKHFSKEAIDKAEQSIYREVIEYGDDFSYTIKETLGEDVRIWGAGFQGGKIYEYLQSKGIHVSGYIDNNVVKQGSTKDGVDVVSPRQVQGGKIIVPNDYYREVYAQAALLYDETQKVRLIDFNSIKASYGEM